MKVYALALVLLFTAVPLLAAKHPKKLRTPKSAAAKRYKPHKAHAYKAPSQARHAKAHAN